MKTTIDIYLEYQSETGTSLDVIKRGLNELENPIRLGDYERYIMLEEDVHTFLLNYIQFLKRKILENAEN